MGGDNVGVCAHVGQSGPQCRVCSLTGEYYSGEGHCARCPDMGPRLMRLGSILMGVVLLISSLCIPLFCPQCVPSVYRVYAEGYSVAVLGALRFVSALDLQPKLKIVVAFCETPAFRN